MQFVSHMTFPMHIDHRLEHTTRKLSPSSPLMTMNKADY